MKQASSCPTCGAPIYVKERKNRVPEVFFTCECRLRVAEKPAESDPLLPYKLLENELEKRLERQRSVPYYPVPYPVYPLPWTRPFWQSPIWCGTTNTIANNVDLIEVRS